MNWGEWFDRKLDRKKDVDKVERYNQGTKQTENLSFVLKYADGTEIECKDGVLFTINDEGTMDIHVGVDKLYKLFGVSVCLTEFITYLGLNEEFERYLEIMSANYGGEK